MPLPEDQHPVHTLTLDAPDEPLNQAIQMRRHRQGPDRLDAGIPEHLPELLGKEGVPVVNQETLVLHKAREGVCQVPGHQPHPSPVGLLGDADDLHFPGGIVNAHQDIVPGQASPGVDFGGKEVNRCQGFPVGLEELGPFGPACPAGTGVVAVPFEDVVDGSVADPEPQVLQGTLDSPGAPGLVLAGQHDDQVDDLLGDTLLPALPVVGAVKLSGHQHAVPFEDRIRREDTTGILQDRPAQFLAQTGQPHPLIITQNDPFSAQFFP